MSNTTTATTNTTTPTVADFIANSSKAELQSALTTLHAEHVATTEALNITNNTLIATKAESEGLTTKLSDALKVQGSVTSTAELDAMKAKLAKVQSELNTSKQSNTNLESELTKAKANPLSSGSGTMDMVHDILKTHEDRATIDALPIGMNRAWKSGLLATGKAFDMPLIGVAMLVEGSGTVLKGLKAINTGMDFTADTLGGFAEMFDNYKENKITEGKLKLLKTQEKLAKTAIELSKNSKLASTEAAAKDMLVELNARTTEATTTPDATASSNTDVDSIIARFEAPKV